MRLTFGDMTKKVNVFNLGEQPCDMDDQPLKVNLIENLTSEHDEEIKVEAECLDTVSYTHLTLPTIYSV